MSAEPCGSPIHFRGAEFRSAKRFWHGTQRAVSPRETLDRIAAHCRRIGLTRLANITGLDRIGIPTVVSVRPAAGYLSVDGGKGFTLDAALASASMECVERQAAETIRPAEIRVSHERLQERHAVIPASLLPLSRHSLWTTRTRERWTLGWDLIGQREVAVPVSMVTLERHRNDWTEPFSFQASTNGLASGNTFPEALSSALHEVVERDAIACQGTAWRSGAEPMRRVDLHAVAHPLVQDLLARFAAVDVGVAVLDCTTDTDVAVYKAIIYDLAARHLGTFGGYGAHLDPEVAMVRAMTEAVQSRLIFISGSRDDVSRQRHLLNRLNDDDANVRVFRNPDALAIAPTRQSSATASFEGDVNALLDRLRRVGITQAIAFDLTPPGVDVSVARVIVPGLEGYITDYYTAGARARRAQGSPS